SVLHDGLARGSGQSPGQHNVEAMTDDAAAEVEALAAALARRPPRPTRWSMEGRVQAAVCVPVHPGGRGLEIWAIKRTASLRDHAREIAFPGGKRDEGDRDLADTALR